MTTEAPQELAIAIAEDNILALTEFIEVNPDLDYNDLMFIDEYDSIISEGGLINFVVLMKAIEVLKFCGEIRQIGDTKINFDIYDAGGGNGTPLMTAAEMYRYSTVPETIDAANYMVKYLIKNSKELEIDLSRISPQTQRYFWREDE